MWRPSRNTASARVLTPARRADSARARSNEKALSADLVVTKSLLRALVGLAGFEPTTP